MATRRDQLHSYQFMTQRVISAFVMRETDPAQSPLRRGVGALFGGLMVAILVAAGFGIYGLLTKIGTDKWKSDGSVVVERETGASFVYLTGRLHPTLNVASAKLAAGRPNAQVQRIAAKALAEVPRGVMVGIPGAPASLPGPKQAIGLPWTICAIPAGPAGGGASILLVGTGAPGGAAAGERGVLVEDPGPSLTYLIWHGRRHLIQDARTTVPGLFGAVTPTPVGTAWLNALPAGAAIEPLKLPDRGERSAAATGRRIGDVLQSQTGTGTQYYVVVDDGLAAITPLQEKVLASRWPAAPSPISIADALSIPPVNLQAGSTTDVQPPEQVPNLATRQTGEPLCASTADQAATPAISLGGDPAALAGAVPTSATAPTGQSLADGILVPAGRIAVVRVIGANGYALITDLGLRYAVPSADALSYLGYAPASAVPIPAALLNRIPAGPTLDPEVARRPAPAGTTQQASAIGADND